MNEPDELDKIVEDAKREAVGEAPPPAEKPPETPGTPPAAGTPAAQTPLKRIVSPKVDGVERHYDIDEYYADETKRGELKGLLEKGLSFDEVVKRRQRDGLTEGQNQALAWFKAQGYDAVQDPATGKWSVRTVQAAIPAQPAPQSPAIDLAGLKKKAREGDAEALATLIDHLEAAQRQPADEWKTWRAEQERKAAEAANAQQQQQATNWFNGEIEKTLARRAKSFEGPRSEALRQHARMLGWSVITTNPQATAQQALAAVEGFANDLDAERAEVTKALATARPAPSAPPSVNGTAPATSGGGDDLLDPDSDDFSAKFAAAARRGAS